MQTDDAITADALNEDRPPADSGPALVGEPIRPVGPAHAVRTTPTHFGDLVEGDVLVLNGETDQVHQQAWEVLNAWTGEDGRWHLRVAEFDGIVMVGRRLASARADATLAECFPHHPALTIEWRP
ncbi:hypothetical protein [Nocardiopsis synnemataformans]|uniref:hypothetical protein n=1 Tax=Nocardiopsis synnemataformans TaxID=61305 RepID=UPI003EBA51B6